MQFFHERGSCDSEIVDGLKESELDPALQPSDGIENASADSCSDSNSDDEPFFHEFQNTWCSQGSVGVQMKKLSLNKNMFLGSVVYIFS